MYFGISLPFIDCKSSKFYVNLHKNRVLMTFKHIYSALSILLIMPLLCNAQAQGDLPVFKQDKIYTHGVLANGMNYYFASNPTHKGSFDFSLVQKVDPNLSDAQLGKMAVDNFYRVKALTSSFRQFLTRNGIGPTEDGYFDVEKGSIRYNFCKLSSAMPELVVDSTLLAVFDLARLYARAGSPTKAQAIVVAGDFDQKEMLTKIKLLSMIAPSVKGTLPEMKFQWDPNATPHSIVTTTDGALSAVEAVWNEARTPKEYMNTALPVISDKLAAELGIILKRRLEAVLRLNKVNAWIDYLHTNSAMSVNNDEIRFTINCMTSDAPLVEDIMKRELTRLYTWGADPVEYYYARNIYRYRWIKSCDQPNVKNSTLRHNCISAFLYGASLASEKDKINFVYRDMPLEKQTDLFNNYMKRLLSQTVHEDKKLYRNPYLRSKEEIDAILAGYAPVALKTPKEKEEPVTAGTMWTYSNGVNFIHKKMPSKGITHFAYASRGGRDISDDDDILNIEGIEPEAMQAYLAANGIDIHLNYTPYDVRIEGDVMDENLPVLLKYLCAVSAQKAGSELFSDKCFKLLVLASGNEDHTMASTVAKYAGGLRPSGPWAAVKAVKEDRDDIMSMKHFIIWESLFPLDYTGINTATAAIASHALNDAIVNEFHNVPVYFRNWSAYPGIPIGHYRLMFGVCRFEVLTPDTPLENASNAEIRERMTKVIRSLAEKPVSKERLATYKAMEKNAHFSTKGKSGYYIKAALDRYMDNKNFWGRYHILLDGVTPQAIMDFYASAAYSNR